MAITITAFDWVPDFARGQVRDLRARWVLEEAGRPYDIRYLSQGEQKQWPHRALQPFGQIPTLEDQGLTLFESGAIVLYVADTYGGGLIPSAAQARARTIEWVFAALNTVEPPIMDRAVATLFEADRPWSEPRLPAIEDRIRERLSEVADRLGEREWYEDDFSAGDLLMIAVLRALHGSDLLAEQPRLSAYVARGEARPAFRRALDGQIKGFTGAPPPGWPQ